MAHPPTRRHPTVDKAWHLARAWYADHTLDGLPALTYAIEVTEAVARCWPDPPPGLVAAALLHDAPRLAPPGTGVYATIAAHLGGPVAETVRRVEYERREGPVPVDATWALHVSTARKTVSVRAALRCAATTLDARAYVIGVLGDRLPWLRDFRAQAAPYLRAAMAADLDRMITAADRIHHALVHLGEQPSDADLARARHEMADVLRRVEAADRRARRSRRRGRRP